MMKGAGVADENGRVKRERKDMKRMKMELRMIYFKV